MKLFFIRFNGYEIDQYRLIDGKIPEGCFYKIAYGSCATEELAHEFIRRVCKPRVLTQEMFAIECIDIPINLTQNQYAYQVSAWIHEESDEQFGYYYSHPYASADEVCKDKLWVDAVNTIFHNNADRYIKDFKNYYEVPESDFFLKQIGSITPFFKSLDGTKTWVKYEASIYKIPIIQSVEDIGRFYIHLKEK